MVIIQIIDIYKIKAWKSLFTALGPSILNALPRRELLLAGTCSSGTSVCSSFCGKGWVQVSCNGKDSEGDWRTPPRVLSGPPAPSGDWPWGAGVSCSALNDSSSMETLPAEWGVLRHGTCFLFWVMVQWWPWGLRTTQVADSFISWKLRRGWKVWRMWGLLPISRAVLLFLPADCGWPHSCNSHCDVLTWNRCSFHVYTRPLWFVCCGFVVIDVTYFTVEKPQEPHRSRAWREACGRPLTICVKGENIIPSRQSIHGAVDSGHCTELQLCGEMGMCRAPASGGLAKVWRPREIFQGCLYPWAWSSCFYGPAP